MVYLFEKLGPSDTSPIESDNCVLILMPEGMPTSLVDNIIAGGGLKLDFCFGQARLGTSLRLHLVPYLIRPQELYILSKCTS